MSDIFTSLTSGQENLDLDKLPDALQALYELDPTFNFETRLLEILKLDTPNFLHNLRPTPSAQIVKIIRAFKPFYSPSEQVAVKLYLLLTDKLIDDSICYDWIFSSPHFDVNTMNFELKADKHFYFYILDLLAKENKSYHSYLSSKNDQALKVHHAAALSFFKQQKVDPYVMYREVRPMDYFLSSMERSHQNQFSKLILAYFKKNPEIISDFRYNKAARRYDSYIHDEHLIKEIESLKPVKPETQANTVKILGFWEKLFAFFFKKTTSIETNLEQSAPISQSLQIELDFSQRFAVSYVALERLLLSLEHKLQTNSQNKIETEQALLNNVKGLLLRFLKLFDTYERQKSLNFSHPSVEFFISKQFPQFLTGSLESYYQALENLSGEDFLAAHTMLLENLQLMGQHLQKQENVFESIKDTSALLKMKVEHKYLKNTMNG